MKQLLTLSELAELLNFSPKTLYQWRYRGEGPPALILGGRVRYRREDVESWLELHEQEGGASSAASG